MHSAIHQSWRTSISDASFYLLTPGAHHNRPIVTYFRISIKLFNPLNVLQPHTPQLTAYSPTPPTPQLTAPHPPAVLLAHYVCSFFRFAQTVPTARAPQPPKPALISGMIYLFVLFQNHNNPLRECIAIGNCMYSILVLNPV